MKKIIVLFLMLVALVLIGVKPVHAAEIPTGVEVYFPNEALDCGVWPDGPVRSGGYVVNTAYVTCATAHPWIKVVAGIQMSGGQEISQSKTCYAAYSCYVDVSVPYVPNKLWAASVSGYINGWQGYYTTGFVPAQN
ncbi:MAG: hypothetical protein AAGU03_05355 [Anaerolineaceae bacterium]